MVHTKASNLWSVGINALTCIRLMPDPLWIWYRIPLGYIGGYSNIIPGWGKRTGYCQVQGQKITIMGA